MQSAQIALARQMEAVLDAVSAGKKDRQVQGEGGKGAALPPLRQ
jgi:hypothetical protein